MGEILCVGGPKFFCNSASGWSEKNCDSAGGWSDKMSIVTNFFNGTDVKKQLSYWHVSGEKKLKSPYVSILEDSLTIKYTKRCLISVYVAYNMYNHGKHV